MAKPGNPPIPKGYQQLTDLTTAKVITAPRSANWAMVRCSGGDVRWRDDGTSPTAATGYPLLEGEELEYDAVTGLDGLRFIAMNGNPEVSLTYYGV